MANAIVKQHVPIFISSTYEDMIPYREEVQRQLIRLEQIVKGMEYFGSSPESSLSICLSQVRESKVFIGILGMRYGSIEQDSELSYSQLEYNEAIKNNIPTLIYILDENHPIPPKNVDKGIHAQKLSEFKELLKRRHTISYFTTPEDLGKKLAHDLVQTLSSLDQIQVLPEQHKDNSSFLKTYEKYLLRPAKYSGSEGELYFKIDSGLTGSTLKENILKGIGLEVGNSVSCYAYALNDDKLTMPVERRISLYADKENADWLETVHVGDIIRARVKLSFCTFNEITRYDGGTILKESSYLGVIIIEGISIK